MNHIPSSFVQASVKHMRCMLLSDLKEGCRDGMDHYIHYACACIWEQFMKWKNSDSCRQECIGLTIRDIAFMCKMRGIQHQFVQDTVMIDMPKHKYYFSDNGYIVFGGPADDKGKYHGYEVSCSDPRITMKAFFKMGEVVNATLKQVLEPGLEDLIYRYSAHCPETGIVELYLYPSDGYTDYEDTDDEDVDEIFGNEKVLQFTFAYEELLANIERVKQLLRILSKNIKDYKYYKDWATCKLVKAYMAPEKSGNHQF